MSRDTSTGKTEGYYYRPMHGVMLPIKASREGGLRGDIDET